jgi:hypothetical protein
VFEALESNIFPFPSSISRYVLPEIRKDFLAICSPNTVLGMASTVTSALELLGKNLSSLSKVPSAAVD